jgi:hypothetical protein
LIAGALAVLLFATGMVASTMAPALMDAPADSLAVSSFAANTSDGMGLAILSILLGSGMVFIFRPKQRVFCHC